MVLHHFGSDLDQRSIIDVARTSDTEGTLSYDIMRAGHFSVLSNASSDRLFPNYAPHLGWNQYRALGNAAFGHRDSTCWVDTYKDVLATGVPIVTLMWYAIGDEGHFRVGVGYDDTVPGGQISLLDPWDRDGQPRVVQYNESYFCTLWNHAENNMGVQYLPYFAAVITPWQVDVSFTQSTDGNLWVSAVVTYPLPPLPDTNSFANLTVQGATVVLTLPPVLQLLNGTDIVSLGMMKPGESAELSWPVVDISTEKPPTPQYIVVTASGVVSSSVPDTYCCQNTTYPAYSYKDLIGGQGQVLY